MGMSLPSPASPVLWKRLLPKFAFAILILLTAAAILAGGWFFAYPTVRAWQHTAEAEKALQSDDLSQAADHLRHAAALQPADARIRFLLARTLRRLGEVSAARRELAEAARLGHPRQEVDLENVLLLAQSGELDGIEETLQALITAGHPETPLALEALVVGYLTLHDLRNAERWASYWLTKEPTAWKAWLLRGKAWEQGVQLDAALQDYLRAAELKPGDVEITFRVGEMLRRLDRYSEALPHLRAAAQGKPDDAAMTLSLAKCLRSLGRTEEALRLLQEWRNQHPETPPEVFALLGRLAADLHRTDEALSWLSQAERVSPGDEDTLNTLAVLYRELGQDEEAEKYDARAKDVHRKIKRIDALLRALKNDPRNVEIRHEIGWLLVTLGHYDKALPWLLSALEQNADHQPTHHALAEYYEAIGDRETARNHRLAAQGKAKARIER
ncbi:MAG: tetratricopeptide repeat protein [Gemmatales bacterium]|nr:tetratricopeptide repeat protein [Gemmatales bacterium]MDW8386801.1 tetratricopeptide repeat protein [Gemmatales bacterium]